MIVNCGKPPRQHPEGPEDVIGKFNLKLT
jgi:hypothetical protein